MWGARFGEPFLAGIVSSPQVPRTFPVAVNGHPYLLDIANYKRTTLPANRQPIDQSVEPGEQSLNAEGLWRRSQENWVLGAGQEFLDNRTSQFALFTRAGENQSIRYRFSRSKGLDPWTDGHLTLLPETERKQTSAATNMAVLVAGTTLYMVDGNEIYWITDPQAATWTRNAAGVAAGASAVVAVATDGAQVWALLQNGHIWVTTIGSGASADVYTVAAAGTPTAIAYIGGHLLVAKGQDVVEVNRSYAGETLIGSGHTHLSPAWAWTRIVQAPDAVYLVGHCGSVGEVWATGFDTTTGAFKAPVLAAPTAPGEIVNDLAPLGASACVLATSLGIRLAEVSSSGGLTLAPAIVVPGGSLCLAEWSEYVWFGWTAMVASQATNPLGTATSSGLGRISPGRSTSTLVPAYASDVMAVDGVTGTVTGVVVLGDRRYFCVAGSGVWGENANKVAQGYLLSGVVRFGTVEPKVVVEGDWRCKPLDGTLGMFVIKEDGSAVHLVETSQAGSFGTASPVDASYAVGEGFQVQIYFKRSAVHTTVGPDLTRWSVRAFCTPQRMDEILAPLIFAEALSTDDGGEGADASMDPWAEFTYLKELEMAGELVRWQEGGSSYRCLIDRIEVNPESWMVNRNWFQGIVLVRLLTIVA